MTLTFGIWHTGESKRPEHDVHALMHTLQDYKADHKSIFADDHVALGQLTVHTTPESVTESLPFQKPGSSITIAGDIRLDNRAELCAKLGISHPYMLSCGDGYLVIAAYQKWGEYCAEHLLGSFAFALWDGEQKRLYCCTDHFNQKGYYYYHSGNKFIFASTPEIILAAKEVKKVINQNKLLPFLAPDTKHLFWNESWYENIFSIPAATMMVVDDSGIKKLRYWTPAIKQTLSFKSEAEYAEAFQEVMFRAVDDRLRSNTPVTALLSGGLDSSAVVAVAAKILKKQNRELEVFSAVLPGENDPVLTDERYYINLFRTFPNVNINYITAPGKSFISDIDTLLSNKSEPNIISRHYLNTAFIQKARSLGSRVILAGYSGELGPTGYAEGLYAEHFKTFKWKYLWHELSARKSITNDTIFKLFRSLVIKPLLPGFMLNLVEPAGNRFGISKHHFLTDLFSSSLQHKLENIRKQGPRLPPAVRFSNHRQNQLQFIINAQNKSRPAGSMDDVEFRSPLLDVRMLEFCLAAPAEFKVRNGYQRNLIRSGLNNILPAEIQWRNSKGAFSPDYHRRYNQQLPEVKGYFAGIQANDPVLNVINMEKLQSWLEMPIADDEYNTYAEKVSRDYIPQAVYLIEFLRRFDEYKIN